ncbi:MAG TPA: hypothetical protein ENG03_07670 [Thioploca sp.]|nr:hypothetical protein [Thioploca sp.]
MAMVEDITERKRAEEALHENQSALAKAQQIAHLGNWRLNVETNQITCSDEVYRIFGVNSAEFQPTLEAFFECFHPDDVEFAR